MAQLEHKFNALADFSDCTKVSSGELGMPALGLKSFHASGKRGVSSSSGSLPNKQGGRPGRWKRHRPVKRNPSRAYKQLWRLVDGAVADALKNHPDYIAKGASLSSVRNSITKRVTGAVLGYAVEAAKSRSPESGAAETEDDEYPHRLLERAWEATRSLRERLSNSFSRSSLERKGRG